MSNIAPTNSNRVDRIFKICSYKTSFSALFIIIVSISVLIYSSVTGCEMNASNVGYSLNSNSLCAVGCMCINCPSDCKEISSIITEYKYTNEELENLFDDSIFNTFLTSTQNDFDNMNWKNSYNDVKNIYGNFTWLNWENKNSRYRFIHEIFGEKNYYEANRFPFFENEIFEDFNKSLTLAQTCNSISCNSYFNILNNIPDDQEYERSAVLMAITCFNFHAEGLENLNGRLDEYSVYLFVSLLYNSYVQKYSSYDVYEQLKISNALTIDELYSMYLIPSNTPRIITLSKGAYKETIVKLIIFLLRQFLNADLKLLFSSVYDSIMNYIENDPLKRLFISASNDVDILNSVSDDQIYSVNNLYLLEPLSGLILSLMWQEQFLQIWNNDFVRVISQKPVCSIMPHSVWHRLSSKSIIQMLEALKIDDSIVSFVSINQLQVLFKSLNFLLNKCDTYSTTCDLTKLLESKACEYDNYCTTFTNVHNTTYGL